MEMSLTANLAYESEIPGSPQASNSLEENDPAQNNSGSTAEFIILTETKEPSGLQDEVIINKPRRSESQIKKGAMYLTWKNVNVYLPAKRDFFRNKVSEKKFILEGVSGYAEPGTLLAIMGSSGAGKSALLNVLTWRNLNKLHVKGDILVNGVPLGPDITKISAYVQQDDIFVGTLTVKEHLVFTANLRMDSSHSDKSRRLRVQEVISQMGLKKCENVRIGIPGLSKTISGGEMKRLSFASEILNRPSILFCDEPTSGLDSYLSRIIVECMRTVSREGCTVISTIHQPSSETFELFDRMLLLALGKVVYHGTSEKAMEFYDRAGFPCPVNYNPADHFIQKVSVLVEEENNATYTIRVMQELFQTSADAREVIDFINAIHSDNENRNVLLRKVEDLRKKPHYHVGFFKQFSACFVRSLKASYRNPIVSTVKLLQTLILAFVFGIIFLRAPFGKPYEFSEVKTVTGSLFLVIIANSLVYLNGVLNVFPAEIPIFRREYFNGMYSVLAYYLSKTAAEFPSYFALPFVHSIIVYFMFGLYPSFTRFFYFYLYVVLLVNVSVSYGYFVSAAAPNTTVSLLLGPALAMPLLIVGGFFIKPDKVPGWLSWLQYVSWFLYANELLNINQWEDVTDLGCSQIATNLTMPQSAAQMCLFRDGSSVLESLGYDAKNLGRDIGGMTALFFSSRLLGLLFLYFRVRESSR